MISSKTLQELKWESTPIAKYYHGKKTFVGVSIVEDGKVSQMVGTTLNKILFGHPVGNWFKAWDSIHYEVNGQVKNYLVALRTLVQAPPGSYKIFIRGSKMTQRGGLWHGYFLEFVARWYTGSTVVFNDPNEFCEVRPIPGVKFEYNLQNTDSVECDVLIDDAHDGFSVLPIKTKAEYFSLKQIGEDKFLINETRYFSHDIDSPKNLACPCIVCEQVGTVTHNYESFMKVLSDVQALGYGRCELHFQREGYLHSDMSRIAKVHAKLQRQGTVQLVTPVDKRSAERLSSLLRFDIVQDILRPQPFLDERLLPVDWKRKVSYRPTSSTCSHVQCKCGVVLSWATGEKRIDWSPALLDQVISHIQSLPSIEVVEDDCYMVRGRSVEFVGVSSDFFGLTQLGKGKAEVVVIGTGVPVPSMHCTNLFSAAQKIAGFFNTGYKWRDKFLHVRKINDDRVFDLFKIGLVKSKLDLQLKEYKPGLDAYCSFPLTRLSDGWRVRRSGNGPLFLAVNRNGDYDFITKSIVKPAEVSLSFFVAWIRGIDLPHYSLKQVKLKSLQWKEILSLYKVGAIFGVLSDFFRMPEDIQRRIFSLLLGVQ